VVKAWAGFGRPPLHLNRFSFKFGPQHFVETGKSKAALCFKNMYCILVYDIGEKRVGKMLKLCRRYLNWIQNSVFEGEITALKLKELKHEAKQIMDVGSDSLIIFTSRQRNWLDKEVVGKERSALDNFL
jgi:CRISPR-associated protein Cas2